MKTTKTVTLFLTLIMILSLFAACGDNSSVKNDVPAEDIASSIAKTLGSDSFVDAPETYINGSMKMEVSSYADYCVKINSKGINIDEFGIFKGNDSKQAGEIKTAVENYLKMRVETWMPEYMPEEFPKLENAEIKTAGNYVMYAILSDSDKTSAFDAFSKALAG